ncbi:hypothetical protein ACQP2T_13470 [Nonomuraea sp. CA-143628]|uniref:hypothetical protein n=1 Tax=Nonomuraea sp. CA-143628 TaxID=3239997 RepID=UPI003D8D859C
MSGRHAKRCPEEPHELHALTANADDIPDAPEEERDRTAEFLKAACVATFDYFRDAPAERLPLLGGAAMYGVGLLLHGLDVPWWAIGLPTVAAGITAYAAGVNRLSMPSTLGVTLAALTCGSWLATVAEVGAGHLTNWIYVGAFSFGYAIYRWARSRAKKGNGDQSAPQPEVVSEETPRITWERHFAGWGMEGAAVIVAEPTRLGERVLLNTKGTGSRASSFVTRGLAERIAEDFDVATARVRVTNAGLPAGQLLISVQLIDPWATVVPHPLFDPDSEITLPEVADVREPLPIGMDPETGEPLTITLYDDDGGKQTLILAVNGGGKSVTLNDILERLTAAFNCVVWGINLSKAQEMRRWAPALDLAACGRDQRKRARIMLKMARKLIVWRGAQHRDSANVIPSARQPMLVLVMDEFSASARTEDGSIDMSIVDDAAYVASKGRSEAVVLLLADQRNTQGAAGTTNITTQMTNYVVLKGVSVGDLARIGIAVPDMGEYGGQHAGVAATLLKSEDRARLGRTFALAAGKTAETGLQQIDRVVESRLPNSLEGSAIAHLGEAYASLKAGQTPSSAATATLEREADDDTAGESRDDMAPEVTSSDERSSTIDEIRKQHLFLVPALTPEGQEKARQMREAEREQAAQEELAAASPLPADVRGKLITLLDREGGIATRDVENALGVSSATAWRYMNHLRSEGAVESHGSGPATRWIRRGDHVA